MSHIPIAAGSPEFRRINRAMVFGGFSTFALLYCVQPLMPLLAHDFRACCRSATAANR
jgi:YNFM family putative membrane transporter